MLAGGLLPFPRTGCVLCARVILSYCVKIRQALSTRRMEQLRRRTAIDAVLLAGTWRSIALVLTRLSTSLVDYKRRTRSWKVYAECWRGLVDEKGIEPSTSALRTPRSPN